MEEKKDIKYKEALREIESILSRIEKEELDVDDLSVKVKRVSHLLNICKKKLRATEEDIEKIMDDLKE